MPIYATQAWPSNSDLIADVAKLYLKKTDRILDPTFGRGTWWGKWKPRELITHDIKIDGVDFRKLPHKDEEFDVVALDPPYMLRGSSSNVEFEDRYGLEVIYTWQDRHQMIRHGMKECTRVLKPKGILLVKCMSQVCSGKVRWQDYEFAQYGMSIGLELEDRFDLLSTPRSQPPRTRKDGKESVQKHSRRNTSTLLIFRK